MRGSSAPDDAAAAVSILISPIVALGSPRSPSYAGLPAKLR